MLEIHGLTRSGSSAKTRLRKIADDLMRNERRFPPEKTIVTFILCTDREIRKMNRIWRKKDKTTDILSFNIEEMAEGGYLLGELYLSLPQVERQAKALNHPVQTELEILLIHGLLHLHGYEHEYDATRGQIREMEKREQHYRKLWIKR